jgi:L-ascorbate metabolism protein UlaG (beta-lactamase superfamily)
MTLWWSRAAVLTLLLAAGTAGSVSSGGGSEKGLISNHFDGKRFRSPEPFEVPFATWVKRAVSHDRGPWRKFTPAEQARPEKRVGDGRLRVTFVNHATVLVQMDGLNILTDPTWAERSVPVIGPHRRRPPGIAFSDLPPIDLVLISHDHHDHMDFPTLRQLRTVHAPVVYAGLGTARLLAKRGVPGSHDLDWWQSVEVAPGVTITAVPARHISGRSVFDHNRRLWCGFVISGPSGNVYFAGDTGVGSHFAQIQERFGSFRLALLPIGGATPRWYQEGQHIGPQDVVGLASVLHAGTTMPMHFGTFPQSDDGELEPAAELRRQLETADPRPRFVILDNGQTADVPQTLETVPTTASAAASARSG